jgi:hypothetical protein
MPVETTDVKKLQELTLLLDLAYLHHSRGKNVKYASAEGTIRLEYGSFRYRKENPTAPPLGPELESVVVYSSVFSAARLNYFDSLDDAIATVQSWYELAKEPHV